jgi:O-antigen/teichoic acid export membrane protein
VIVRNILAMGMSRASAIGLDAVTYILLARHLGPLEYGHYVAIAAFVSLVDVMADMMTLDITVRDIARDPARGNAWLTAATLLRLSLAGFGLIAFAAYVWLSPIGADRELRTVAALAALALPLGALRAPLAAFRAHMRIHYEMGVLITARATNLLLVAVFIYQGHGLLHVVAAATVSRVLLAVLAWGLLWARFAFQPRFERAALAELTRGSLPMGVSGLFVAAQLKGDILLVASLVGAHAAGLYGVVAQLPEYLLSIPIIFTAPMLPALARAAAAADRTEFQRLFQTMFDTVMTLVIPLAVVSIVAPAAAVTWLFGGTFAGAAGVLPLVMLSVVFMWFSHAAAVATIAAGLQSHFIWIQSTCVAAYFALDALLIPRWGIEGAAVARLAATILAPVLTCAVLQRRLGVRLTTATLRRAAVPALAMALALAWASHLPLQVATLLGLTLYGAGLWATGCNPLAYVVAKESRA